MQRLNITSDLAQRIVESGSQSIYQCLQNIPTPLHSLQLSQDWRCWFTNEGRWTIEPGEFVGVTGLVDRDLSSEEAIEKYVSEGFRLRVKRIGQIDDGNAAWLCTGIAIDQITSDSVGRGYVYDAFMASVWRDPDAIGESRRFIERADWKTTDWTDPQGVSRRIRRLAFVKYPGDFTVVDAAAPDNEENVFCLCRRSFPGPVLDTISSVDVSAGVAQMSCGVSATSPLVVLTASHTGKRAMLFRNTISRNWHILLKQET